VNLKALSNEAVPLTGRARHFAVVAKAVSVDTEGTYTTLAHWLCGDNPWGFHNDMRFSLPVSNVKQGVRIMEAAQEALRTNGANILLSEDDYEVLLSAVTEPRRHPTEMEIPPELARSVLPLITAIEAAKDFEEPKMQATA